MDKSAENGGHVKRVLVAHKKSKYEMFVDDGNQAALELVRKNDPSVSSVMASHARHIASLEAVLAVLKDRGIAHDVFSRSDVHSSEGYDLVVAVGGDGTVLDISHRIGETPILAINSDPVKSVGYFCAGSSDEFGALLSRVIDDHWQPSRLMRFNVAVNGVEFPWPILNDILVSHANPAAVTSVLMQVGEGEAEAQRSSGIWISTPAGSTAAIRSAGGYVMPLESRALQYLVREPCPPVVGAYRHVKGIRRMDERFAITSRMEEGMIYLDGPHVTLPFVLGDVLTLDDSAPDLCLFGIEHKERG